MRFEQEKAIRMADTEANAKRTIELQLKAEKARAAYLETKMQRSEADVGEVASNLDAWRSAAIEQRLRAEQATVSWTDRFKLTPDARQRLTAGELPLAPVCAWRRPAPARAVARDAPVRGHRRGQGLCRAKGGEPQPDQDDDAGASGQSGALGALPGEQAG